MHGFPERWNLICFALAAYFHAQIRKILTLLFQNAHHINAAATAQGHKQSLHGPHAEALSTAIRTGIHADHLAAFVVSFKAIIGLYPVDCYADHAGVFTNVAQQAFTLRAIHCRMQYFHHPSPFITETGASLQLTIAYKTYGRLHADKRNVVWICHALTANADAESWWPGVVGTGCAIDPEKHFIICANILGSHYGTTGPLSIDPATNAPYCSTFPLITIRDMVRAHILLRQHLGIDRILLLAGGSMGGYQALEWALMEKELIQNLLLLATAAAESAWGIAIHTAQRMAIEADESWQQQQPDGGKAGLKAARAIGMLTYRNYALFAAQQADPDPEKLDHFKASAYLNYQGEKLVQRFNAYSYWTLTKAMDTHQLARGRKATIAELLQQIKQPALVIGISSDLLCPPDEQRFLASHLPNARYEEIDSPFGHDGFLVEAEKIGALLKKFMPL